MIKLVISDLDGTLIGRDEILSQKAIDLAKVLKKNGIMFTVATGRVECMAEHYVKSLGLEIPYIACNGVTIVKDKEVIMRNKIPIKGLRPMFDKADAMGMSLVYSIDGVESVYKVTPWIISQRKKFDRYHKVHVPTQQEWETLYIDKLMIMDDVREGAIQILEDMCKKLPREYGFTRYTNKSVEIVNRKSSKASALRELAKILGIEMQEILAIGDHQNDIEMVSESGIGAAVANATDGLKTVSDYISSQECIDGVVETVNRFLLLEREKK